MGLETVEIVLAMERSFYVPIPDSAASKCVTVADLQQVLVDQLVATGKVRCDDLEHEVWDGMMVVLARLGYATNRIRAESKWIGDITKFG